MLFANIRFERTDRVEYKIDLPTSTSTVFCISTKTFGVGSASCGPRSLEKFQVFADPTLFTYTINFYSSVNYVQNVYWHYKN